MPKRQLWHLFHQGIKAGQMRSEWRARQAAKKAAKDHGGEWLVTNSAGKVIYRVKYKGK